MNRFEGRNRFCYSRKRPRLRRGLARSVFLTIVVALLTMAIPRLVSADPWINRNITATRVYTRIVYPTFMQTYRFRTTSLGCSYVDPVMFLWNNPSNFEEEWSDDDEGNCNSTITYSTYYTADPLTVIVRPFSQSSAGFVSVQWCWAPVGWPPCTSFTDLDANVFIGGTPVTVATSPPGTPPGSGYHYQTARSFGFGMTDDTVLLGFQSPRPGYPSWIPPKLVAIDDDRGTGLMSKLGPDTGESRLVNLVWVGAYANDGITDLYTNDDNANDVDGDNLGPVLESKLGTCNTSAWPDPYATGHEYCKYAVRGPWWPQRYKDTDADGLSDYDEVFGVDDGFWAFDGQHLPAWGASPIHKDMFFEVDRQCAIPDGGSTCATPLIADHPMITETALSNHQISYAAGPAADVLNPDGTNGIALHFDIGTSCTNKSLCGPWGGGGTILDGGPSFAISMDPARNQIFRKFLLTTKKCNGLDEGGVHCSGLLGPNNGFAHEMGHTLGLQHWGIDAWGGNAGISGLPCKPNYRSIMAYHTANDANVTFSLGQYGLVGRDPSRTPEHAAMIAPADYLVDYSAKSHMNFPIASGIYPYDVDFNRDGVIDDGSIGLIRAGITVGGSDTAQCYASEIGNSRVQSFATSTVPIADATPDIAGFDYGGMSRLFVFWTATIAGKNVVVYRSDTRSGPNHKGSCSGGNGLYTETNCNSWATFTDPLRGPDNGSQNITGVAATEWGNRLYVAYLAEDGVIRVAYYTSYDGAGALGSWTTATVPTPTGGIDSISQVEITPMYVDPSKTDFGSVTSVLAIFVVSEGIHKWSFLSPSGSWSAFRNVTVGGVNVPAAATAGVATWPNRKQGDASWPDYSIPANCNPIDPSNIDICTACGVFTSPEVSPGAGQRVKFLCYKRSTDEWLDFTSRFGPFGPPFNKGSARPGIAFHTLREGPSSPNPASEDYVRPLYDDPRFGQFWITVTNNSAFPASLLGQLYVTTRVDPLHPLASMTINPADILYNNNGLPKSGLPLYEDGWLSALKGARIAVLPQAEGGPPPTPELFFFPFVDGSFRAHDLRDGNDYQVIESNVCKSLWPAAQRNAKCGIGNPFGY